MVHSMTVFKRYSELSSGEKEHIQKPDSPEQSQWPMLLICTDIPESIGLWEIMNKVLSAG
jgi:hypothetical protein